MSSESPEDDGFVAVVAAGLICLAVLLGSAVWALGLARGGRHAAETAADLAALAGARNAILGESGACDHARDVARENGARLVSCRLDGLDAVVEVERALPGRMAAFGPVRARARAGRA